MDSMVNSHRPNDIKFGLRSISCFTCFFFWFPEKIDFDEIFVEHGQMKKREKERKKKDKQFQLISLILEKY